ncbi:MAG: hypothetical protein HY541_06560 [Deltaproteobacteria bacterium]|nr:hypothetical protein [Deltaproteobacteria bacterium]
MMKRIFVFTFFLLMPAALRAQDSECQKANWDDPGLVKSAYNNNITFIRLGCDAAGPSADHDVVKATNDFFAALDEWSRLKSDSKDSKKIAKAKRKAEEASGRLYVLIVQRCGEPNSLAEDPTQRTEDPYLLKCQW